jgi:hypothetical protein
MKHFLQQLKRSRDTTVLDRAKKDAVREELVNYMRATRAVREQEMERQSMVKRSPIFTNKRKSMKFASFIALAVILAGGGTAFAAEGTLPGDALYPVKVGVNERVAAAFNVSAESQARFNARMAERRLEETARLAAEGRLNAEAEVELEASFKSAADRAEARIEALRASGKASAAAEISSAFEAALAAHARALQAIQAHVSDSDQLVHITATLNSALDTAMQARAGAQGQVTAGTSADVEAAAEGKIGAAANVIAAAQSRLEDLRARLSAEAEAQAEAELDAAAELEADARAQAEAGAYAEAFALAHEALRAASQVHVLLGVQAQFSGSAGAAGNAGTSGDGNGENSSTPGNSGNAPVLNLFGSGEAEAEADAEAEAGAGTEVNAGPVRINL